MATKKVTTTPTKPAKAAQRQGADGAARVLRQFRLVFNAVKTHFQQVERRTGVGGAQIWAMSIIQARPGIGVSELARAMDVRQPTASNAVKLLVEQGLIEVRPDDRDGRAVRLHLRSAGAQLLRRVPGPFSGVLPDALARLEPGVLDRLEADLTALIVELGADERGASIPLGEM